nr:site-specific integrase [uncultured Oscillibacter sp.]
MKHSAVSGYRDLAARINPAIGHIRLKDLRADHLNDLYAGLSQKGTRKEEARATAKIDLAAQLKAKNITYRADRGIYEDTPKTSTSGRFIALPEETMQLLRQYRAWQNEERLRLGEYYSYQGFVFSQDNGKLMRPDSVTAWLSKFSKRHGLPHVNPHAFRHTMASMLYFNSVDSVSISKRLGHSKISTTTDIYAHVIAAADQQNADILADIFLKKA